MDFNTLSSVLSSLEQPKYRYQQILEAYYSGRYQSFLEITNLPADLRSYLQSNQNYYSLTVVKTLESANTSKVLYQTHDGYHFESVLMRYPEWNTVCLSSQIGCPLGCQFCATGKMGFIRNLTDQEIVEQILHWKKNYQIDRLVFMGMGEPFLNYQNIKLSLTTISQQLKIGSRKISVSTAGIIPQIKEFALDFPQINLAISLHSVNPSIRSTIMPISNQYPLKELLVASKDYVTRTKRQLFFEYALFKDINDSFQEIEDLSRFINSNYLYFLNLIPVNQVQNGLTPSPRFKQVVQQLNKNKVNFSERQSFGQEINSACGQLACITGKI